MNPHEKETQELAMIESALVDDFGMRVNDLAPIREAGDSSKAFSATHEGKRIIIKIIGNDQGTYPVEVASLQLLGEHGVPVAEPLGYREKAKYINQPMIIQTAVEGTPMSKSKEALVSPELHVLIGEMLRKIHQIKLKGFGKLKVLDGRLQGQSPSWKASLSEYNPNGVSFSDVSYLVDHGFINKQEAQKIENVFAEVLEIDLPQASFLHNDVGTQHVYTDGQKITGLIDMGSASAGDPRFDIAKAHFYYSRELWNDFNKGYGEMARDPLVTKYFLLVAARKLIYRHSRNFTERIPLAIEALKKSLDREN